jgi:uncharacterized protein (TIGR00369 family)
MVSLKDRMQAIKDGKEEPPPIAKTLGINVVELGEGHAAAVMNVDQRFHNPMGTLHGGIMTDLADLCMGVAIATLLEDDESFTTLELKINFLRPVFEGQLSGEAKVIHKGRTVALVESILKSGEGKEVARATATQMILKSK